MQNTVAHQQAGTKKRQKILLPQAPILTLSGAHIYWLTADGVLNEPSKDHITGYIQADMPITCHAPSVAQKLRLDRFSSYDVLELYAFVRPAEFCLPTIDGLAQKLDIFSLDDDDGHKCVLLLNIVRHLLLELWNKSDAEKYSLISIAWVMGLGDNPDMSHEAWPWTHVVLSALGAKDNKPEHPARARAALQIWHHLPEWSERAPQTAPSHYGVTEKEAQDRLTAFLSSQKNSEVRQQQLDYAAGTVHAFAPIQKENEPNVVIAEAGTGVGKTLGYLSSATLWAEKNEGTVWISTFTRNLQRQIDNEMERLYPDKKERARKVVIRKGRENYLCLLNLEDSVNNPSLKHNGLNATAIGLMARWASVSRDGDLMGGDFPGWLSSLLGWGRTYGLSDRRGECIYAACDHYHKCFVEKSIRRAKHANIVIANHALVMIQAAIASPNEELPSHYVFDEGHHLFEAADSAFSCHLSGVEAADLRRWILGAETNKRSRARGLKRRVEDLVEKNQDALDDLTAALNAAQSLPGTAWRQRLYDNKPKGVMEQFLSSIRQQTYARTGNQEHSYSLETNIHPMIEGLDESAYALSLRLNDLKRPLLSIIKSLCNRLQDDAEDLDTDTRQRIEALCHSLKRRADMITAWLDMLKTLKEQGDKDFIDWFSIERVEGKDYDIGMHRHWVDPMKPFDTSIKPHLKGVVITSATLRDYARSKTESDDTIANINVEKQWETAEKRTAISLLTSTNNPAKRIYVQSPFNYKKQSRILVVKDVIKNNPYQVASAYRELFIAAKGGALGLFTAISRMQAVYDRLSLPLSKENIPLYAQHLEGLDVSTLINMFKMDVNSCLLGTDATRDGMDVPGESLRLIVFDRVPWSRPTILHKARRGYFGREYDDMLTRFKLKQAYGRLIRKATDKGVFIMLDPMIPTRLCSAFPDDVEIERISLKEAIEITHSFTQG